MNPDYYTPSHEYTIWTIKDQDGDVITFKEVAPETRNGAEMILVTRKGKQREYPKKLARSIWDDYMRRGYSVIKTSKVGNCKSPTHRYNEYDYKKEEEDILKKAMKEYKTQSHLRPLAKEYTKDEMSRIPPSFRDYKYALDLYA